MCPFLIPGTLWSWYPLRRFSPDDDDDEEEEEDDDDGKWCSLLMQETNKLVPALKLESRVAFMSGPSTR